MKDERKSNKFLQFEFYRGAYYEENLVVNIKGSFQKYSRILSLVTSIDLSENNLSGNFPAEMTNLRGLVVLNISGNQISDHILENISNMHQLSSLDVSSNKFSSVIPPSMSLLSFLGYMNLSNNDLSGRIPYTGNLSTFDKSSFEGNSGLCGAPLVTKCNDEESTTDSNQVNTDENEEINNAITGKWFYLSVGLGFSFGILVPFLILAMSKSWSEVYFAFVDMVVGMLISENTEKSPIKSY